MKHLATYCLLVLDGKASVSKKDVEDFMKASGVTSDPASLYIMMTRLEGKTLPWLIKEVSGKLAAMPAGGAVPAVGLVPALLWLCCPGAESRGSETEARNKPVLVSGMDSGTDSGTGLRALELHSCLCAAADVDVNSCQLIVRSSAVRTSCHAIQITRRPSF